MYEIYIYKEYCDKNACGEEKIVVFEKRADAEAYLKKSVEYAYGKAWKQIPSELELTKNDVFKPDYVSISNNDGMTSFWIVEGKVIQKENGIDVFRRHLTMRLRKEIQQRKDR